VAVTQIQMPDGSKAWHVTGYDDVRSGLADPRLSLSKNNSTDGYTGFALPPALDANLLNLDPPDHTRLRRLVTGAFSTQGMRTRLQVTANQLLDDISGTVDLMAAYAAPLPVITIGDLLGVPSERLTDFRGWTDTLISQGTGMRQAVRNMSAFIVELIARKRAKPGDDLISRMIAARDGEDRLSEDELLSLAFLILWAGYENSVHLIGNSLRHVLTTGKRPGLDELLRVANPSLHAIRRFAVEDLSVDNTIIHKGQTVLLDIQAANERSKTHLSFGAGIHYCLGAPLAKLELEIALDTVFARYPDMQLVDVQERPSFRSRGLAELRVRLSP
jgi:cytochrome P450